MIRHYHENRGDNTVWHDGSLFDCPDTQWIECTTVDDRPARMAIGMAVSMPPHAEMRLRYMDAEDAVS